MVHLRHKEATRQLKRVTKRGKRKLRPFEVSTFNLGRSAVTDNDSLLPISDNDELESNWPSNAFLANHNSINLGKSIQHCLQMLLSNTVLLLCWNECFPRTTSYNFGRSTVIKHTKGNSVAQRNNQGSRENHPLSFRCEYSPVREDLAEWILLHSWWSYTNLSQESRALDSWW